RRARTLAGAASALRTHLGDGLGRGRLEPRAVGRALAAPGARRGGLDRLLLGRALAWRQGPRGAGVPDPVRGAHPARRRVHDRRRRAQPHSFKEEVMRIRRYAVTVLAAGAMAAAGVAAQTGGGTGSGSAGGTSAGTTGTGTGTGSATGTTGTPSTGMPGTT